MAYVVKPFGRVTSSQPSKSPVRGFAEIQAVEAEVSDLTERLESRKVVERAKGLLQSGLG
jgi:response regulator NasT